MHLKLSRRLSCRAVKHESTLATDHVASLFSAATTHASSNVMKQINHVKSVLTCVKNLANVTTLVCCHATLVSAHHAVRCARCGVTVTWWFSTWLVSIGVVLTCKSENNSKAALLVVLNWFVHI